jgi:hypothetical protein
MPFYPLLKAPAAKGWIKLPNFPPNNWEINSFKKYINLSWADGDVWNSRNIGILGKDKFIRFNEADFENILPPDVCPFLSLTSKPLMEVDSNLPTLKDKTSNLPLFRAAIGLQTNKASVSYQGEINPFHAPGSLLSFCPFIQTNSKVKNYLLFVNLESSGIFRTAEIEIFDSSSCELKHTSKIGNNRVSVISLDNLGFNANSLPFIICREMSGIPLFYSTAENGKFLSLEHSHPPASFVVHGDRWGAQKVLKQKWFSKVN